MIKVGDSYLVPLSQPQRGLIPLLLDEQAVRGPGRRRAGRPHPDRHPQRPAGRLRRRLPGRGHRPGSDPGSPGAALIVNGSSINGPVNATGAAGFFVTDSKVRARCSPPPPRARSCWSATTLTGPVGVVDGKGVAPLVAGNTVKGPLTCTGNSPAPTNLEVANSVSGPKFGQCARL